MGSCLGLIWLI